MDKSDQAALKFAANAQRNFDAAARSSKQFFGNMAGRALAAAGTILSVNAVVSRLTSSVQMLAKLDDAAQKTGSSVESLSRIQQTLNAFGHDFAPFEDGIAKLSRGLTTVDDKGSKVARALNALKISARDSNGELRESSEVALDIARELQKYADSAEKTQLAVDAFGKSGADMLPALNDLADNVDRFGGVSAQAAAQGTQLEDELNGIKSQVDLAATAFALDLIPVLNVVTKSWLDTSKGTSLFTEAGKLAGQMIKDLIILGAAAGLVISSLGKSLVTAASQLGALISGDLRAVRDLGRDWAQTLINDAKSYSEFATKIATANRDLTESAAAPKGPTARPRLNYPTEGDEAAAEAAAKKIAALNDASLKFLETLKNETLAVGATSIQIKLLGAAKQAAVTPSQELALAIMTEAQAWARLAQFQEDAKNEFELLEEREKVFRDMSNNLIDYARATDLANESAQFELSLIGKSNAEREIANEERRAEIDLKQRILAITDQVSDAEDRAALIGEATAVGARAKAAARLQAIARTSGEEWNTLWSTVENTGRMAFVNLLAHGTGSMKAIGASIKASVIDLLFHLTARKWMINIGTSFSSSLAGMFGLPGTASAAGNAAGVASSGANAFNLMNIASGARSAFSAFSGGASSLVGALGTSAIGQALGLGVAGGSTLGAGVGAGAGAGTAFIGGAGTAIGGTGATVAGLSSMGTMLAAAAGPLAIAAAADLIFRLIAGNKTIKGAEALTYVPVIGPLINMLFGMGPKKLGPAELTGQFTEAGFSGEFQADWKRKAGLMAFGKKTGRRGLGISAEQVAALNAMVLDISVPFEELTKKTGDAGRSLAGWTFEVKRAIETEEQQEALTKDLTNSIGAKLIPELTLIQQKGETLADTAARASAEFTLMSATIDLTGQSFGATGLASLGLRDSLVQLLGGIDAAGAALQPFFENFYSEAERSESGWRLLNAEMTRLGVHSLPTTREGFRAIVEAQDLSTAAGQKMFASLIALAPAFATLTEEAEKARESIALLTEDSFTTLVDYTRYIRLAVNAGIAPKEAEVFTPGTNAQGGASGGDNSALLAELRQLREEQKAGDISLAVIMGKVANILGRWEGDGMPDVRDLTTA